MSVKDLSKNATVGGKPSKGFGTDKEIADLCTPFALPAFTSAGDELGESERHGPDGRRHDGKAWRQRGERWRDGHGWRWSARGRLRPVPMPGARCWSQIARITSLQTADPASGVTSIRGSGLHRPNSEQPAEPKQVSSEGTKQTEKGDKKPPQPEPPIETNRKIIRTGEMEFEIESFDKSVESITRLITAIKEGFVATINSDKLANGKMRGTIVVRMPPQYLDQVRAAESCAASWPRSGELQEPAASSASM